MKDKMKNQTGNFYTTSMLIIKTKLIEIKQGVLKIFQVKIQHNN